MVSIDNTTSTCGPIEAFHHHVTSFNSWCCTESFGAVPYTKNLTTASLIGLSDELSLPENQIPHRASFVSCTPAHNVCVRV